MKKSFMVLVLLVSVFTLPLPLLAAEAFFTWTPIPETALAGYKIYYGTATGKYTGAVDQKKPATVNGKVTGSVPGLVAGTTYYFAATAYDTDGFESLPSKEVKWTAHDRLTTPLEFYAAPEKKITVTVE